MFLLGLLATIGDGVTIVLSARASSVLGVVLGTVALPLDSMLFARQVVVEFGYQNDKTATGTFSITNPFPVDINLDQLR